MSQEPESAFGASTWLGINHETGETFLLTAQDTTDAQGLPVKVFTKVGPPVRSAETCYPPDLDP
jgi:hypothetical protein